MYVFVFLIVDAYSTTVFDPSRMRLRDRICGFYSNHLGSFAIVNKIVTLSISILDITILECYLKNKCV
jgi:hypothetical protein